MRTKTIMLLLVLAVAAAVAVSGCTGGKASTDTSSSTSTTTGATAAPTQAATAKPSAPAITLKDNGNFNWAEYNMKITKTSTPQKMRFDMTKEDYQGTPAKHMKLTMTLYGIDAVSDIYYSQATGKCIAASTTAMGHTTTVDAANLSQYDNQDPSTSYSQFSSSEYVFKGTTPDVVIENGHTYTCSKYTYWESYSKDGSSRWEIDVDPNVPLPVKMVQFYKNEESTSMALQGWG